MPRYGSRYRRRLGGNGPVAPFGRPLYPVPFTRRKRPATSITGAPIRMGRRVRPRLAGKSYTKTQRKKKLFGRARKLGDNSSISATYIGRRWNPRAGRSIMKNMLGVQCLASNAVSTSTSTQGKQGIKSFQILTRAQLNELTIAANGGGAFPDNPIKVFLQFAKMKLNIKNQSNLVGRLTLYDIDYIKTPAGTGFDDPQECWAKGFTDLSASGQEFNIGCTPYLSPEFRQNCRVRRVTVINMEPGQQHEHNVYFAINRVCDSTRWSNWTSNAIGWLTTTTMCVWNGSLGHESTTNANVTYMPMKLDFAYHYDVRYGVLEKKQTAFTMTNNLPTVTNFDFMGENQDADIDNADA